MLDIFRGPYLGPYLGTMKEWSVFSGFRFPGGIRRVCIFKMRLEMSVDLMPKELFQYDS